MTDAGGTPFIPPLGIGTPSGGHTPHSQPQPLGALPYSPNVNPQQAFIPEHMQSQSSPFSWHNARPTLQGGLSADYTGYPQWTPQTIAGNTPLPGAQPPLHHTPHPHPQAFPNTPFVPPQMLGPHPMMNTMMNPMLMGTPYNMPQMMPNWPPHMSPYAPPQQSLHPHAHAHPSMAPPWGMFPPPHPAPPPQAQPAQPPAGPFDMSGMQSAMLNLGRATEHGTDRVSKWNAGPNYGPVLEPFLTRILEVQPEVNPLLTPKADPEEEHIRWSMLHYSNTAQRTSDPGHVSWSRGREEPATWPRVTSLLLIPTLSSLSSIPTVYARKPDIGVTCGDVIDTISAALYTSTSGSTFNSCQHSALKKAAATAYRRNRSTFTGMPGGRLGDGMKKLDWLGEDYTFGGVQVNPSAVKVGCGFGNENGGMPCTFELVCVPPTQGESAPAPAALERAPSAQPSPNPPPPRIVEPTPPPPPVNELVAHRNLDGPRRERRSRGNLPPGTPHPGLNPLAASVMSVSDEDDRSIRSGRSSVATTSSRLS
ncbi:hypothetical protein Moror_2399 [Moniliophthora roreri MCA 2997]|uniref:DUF6699 domain-containing protein n=1 Tax=Moniliophthora roreri (strain MCA 2997) TaxID=1381753 RepID=V2Y2E6_MONRO|nr:hypothetical protein Moror_2399 [Moniliophthora roreri MCA 2997]